VAFAVFHPLITYFSNCQRPKEVISIAEGFAAAFGLRYGLCSTVGIKPIVSYHHLSRQWDYSQASSAVLFQPHDPRHQLIPPPRSVKSTTEI